MSIKILARDDNGNKLLVDPSTIGSSNVILLNVPCDASVYIGSLVRMDGTGTSHNALADNIATSNVIGIVESKPSSLFCNIRVTGLSDEILTGLDVTKIYFLSNTVPGGMQLTPPMPSGHVSLTIGQPFSDKKFLYSKGEATIRT